MSDTTILKPPTIGVHANTNDASRILGGTRASGAAIVKPTKPTSPQQKRGGEFGAPVGVQLSRRGVAPQPRAPEARDKNALSGQSLRMLESALVGLANYCASLGNAGEATAVARDALLLVKTIAAGHDISDAPVPKAPTTPPVVTPPTSTPAPTAK